MIRSLLSVAVLAGLAALGCHQSAVAADFISGSQLAHACASNVPADRFSCDGFIAGVLDTVSGSVELKDKMCVPAGMKLSTLREALGHYGQQHTDATRGSGVAFLYAMMKSEYPCPESKATK